ncbi:unnamed protein product [Rotaria magnacalcarata]|uniref:Reverse transcriptase n=1 Tax=Rotaria magnacalcarata TaxID=392030 RepID=A0A816NRX8_9BILA|nr:unnamed protein product [Rotaria magnacalcarata]
MLDEYLQRLTDAIHASSVPYNIKNKLTKKCVPGWNSTLKPLFDRAHKAFINWKCNGKPLHGCLLDEMRVSRGDFKRALKDCRISEENIRNEKIMQSLGNKNMKQFWSTVSSVREDNFDPPTLISGETNHNKISDKFSNMYQEIFNDAKCQIENSNPKLQDPNLRLGQALYNFNNRSIYLSINNVKPTVGPDFIHLYHLKYGPDILHRIICKFFNTCLLHGYLPPQMSNSTIVPLIKNKFGNLHDINNYRPIFNSSTFLKIFEYCVFLMTANTVLEKAIPQIPST